jgi:hypothetical protein
LPMDLAIWGGDSSYRLTSRINCVI